MNCETLRSVKRGMMPTCYSRAVRCTFSPSSLFFSCRNPRPPLACATRSNCSVSISPTISHPTPLFLRPPTHSAALSDLRKWRDWANHLALSVGSKFLDTDNGTDAHLLCREFKWLLEDVLGDRSLVSTLDCAGNGGSVWLRADLEELYSLWKQRIEERRPFQYLVGCEHWRDLVLCVQEGVLIPRPETEKIVDMVEEVLLSDEGMREGLWVDLGTGSGALAVAIARMLGNEGRVIATDLSPTAASVAAFNVQRYALQVSDLGFNWLRIDFDNSTRRRIFFSVLLGEVVLSMDGILNILWFESCYHVRKKC